MCRGLFNDKFLKQKEKIVKKLDEEKYIAIKSDYENGCFVFGSICKNLCSFCFDKYLPNHIIRKIPFLSKYEIIHFLHYLSLKISHIGTSFHCGSGEFFDHPNSFEILQYIPPFLKNGSFIFTNGINLNNKNLGLIKEKNLKLGLSVNTIDDEIRKKIMGYLKDIKLIDIIKEIERHNIKYISWLIPMKSLIESGNFKRTVEYLVKKTKTQEIIVHKPGITNFLREDIKFDLNIDTKLVKKEILKMDLLNKKINLEFDYDEKTIFSIVNSVRILILSSNKKYLVLSPELTYNYFSTLDDTNTSVIKVKSTIGFNRVPACLLTINDYNKSVDKFNEEYDVIVLSRASFDVNFDDFTLKNINVLYNELKKLLILI